ncbi:MAG: pseudaminic acid synthase [Myxococcota bacterium]|nr:pseudaminic acid synthase [Myxococcota bacterium]
MVSKNPQKMSINGRHIGGASPTYFIAEMSGNHCQDFEHAKEIVRAAKQAGADALKMQTYTADTMTIDCHKQWFKIGRNSIWAGRTLYDLYSEAYTPWEWQPKLKELGDELGIEVFSTPFDETAVDFLEQEVGVNAYKISSFEIIDIPLLKKVAATGKPIIMSTGMATLAEIDLAVQTLRQGGSESIALLHCVSAYPAEPSQMNLMTISHLRETFSAVTGLSDHSLSPAVAITAVTLGASIVEKHFTLSRESGGPDAVFSMEPDELSELIEHIRQAHQARGRISYGPKENEFGSLDYRKSIFVVEDMEKGDAFTRHNTRVIRPGYGLKPSDLDLILGRKAAKNIERGTPLSWDLVGS